MSTINNACKEVVAVNTTCVFAMTIQEKTTTRLGNVHSTVCPLTNGVEEKVSMRLRSLLHYALTIPSCKMRL